MRTQQRQELINRLIWSCRRGMLELDVLLDNLAKRLKLMSDNELNTAESLLNLSDDELWELLVARSKEPRIEHKSMVTQIINHA